MYLDRSETFVQCSLKHDRETLQGPGLEGTDKCVCGRGPKENRLWEVIRFKSVCKYFLLVLATLNIFCFLVEFIVNNYILLDHGKFTKWENQIIAVQSSPRLFVC